MIGPVKSGWVGRVGVDIVRKVVRKFTHDRVCLEGDAEAKGNRDGVAGVEFAGIP